MVKVSWICFFGSVLLSGYCIQTGKADVSYKVVEGQKSWIAADRDCRSRDGVLLVLDTHESVKNFQRHVTLKDGQNVWTAAYRMHSPWIWVEGCFTAKFLTKSDGERIVENQASKCSTICQHTPYAALKGNMCFCLEDMRELEALDARICDIPCPGTPDEVCGGEGAISLYSLGGVNGYKDSSADEVPKETVHEASRSDWRNCVYILKHRTAMWITADCRKKLPFLCKIYREEGTVTEYRSPTKQSASWTEARDLCRQEGGTLADLHANNMEAVSALPNESEFWVGLYRNTSWAWHKEQTEEIPSWCTSISEDQVGDLHFKTDSCSLPLSYVCQTGLPSPTASASVAAKDMAVYVTCGTIAWILAILTAVLVVFLMKKRGWRLRRSGDTTTPISTSYFDLDEESVSSSRPSRQHSYVNSGASDQPSCSSPPSGEASDLKPASSSKYQNTSMSYHATGNEYATVSMPSRQASAHYEDVDGKGACKFPRSATSSTSTDGDYDLVWDSVKLEKSLNNMSLPGKRESSSSENIYTEVVKLPRQHSSDRKENDYVTSPSSLFPPSREFGREVEFGKIALGRTRSKSL